MELTHATTSVKTFGRVVKRFRWRRLVLIVCAGGLLALGTWHWRERRYDAPTIEWLRTHAIVLRTTDPSRELTDLQPLASVIGDARIVGVGEATHGTREHFLYKHRLLRFLVTQKNFRALAFESPWPTGLALNEYVLGGDGDPERLLRRAVFGVWHAQEVLDMILWMREHNSSVPPDQRVEFVGIDMQLTRSAAKLVSQYLNRVDPHFRAGHADTLELLAEREMEGLYLQYVGNENPRARITEENRKVSAVVREMLARFDGERERYSAASSADEFAFARQNARILVQQADSCEDLNGADRDRFMADNLDWYMERRPGVKVMVWAHNGHVQIAPRRNGPALGGHLKDRHAGAYLSVGFVLGSGAYRALDARSVPITRARSKTFTFGPPAAGTFNALMAATGHDMFAVNLRSASGDMRKILERPVGLREGYGLVARADPLVTLERSLPATHDILIFIDRTTPAQPIRSQPANNRSVSAQ